MRLWDSQSGQCLRVTHLLPGGHWASWRPGPQGDRIIACSPQAWRWLGWPAGNGGCLPAEAFGPLPVFDRDGPNSDPKS